MTNNIKSPISLYRGKMANMLRWLRGKISSNYLWLSLLLIVTSAIAVFWLVPFNPAPDGKPDRYYYLLSALSQGLAAILAIVFTLSLIAAQLSSRYTQRIMSQFFDWQTASLMGLFIMSTLLPLFLLPSIDRIDAVLVKSSLFLGSVSLILLLPYFWSLKQRLSMENILNNLTRNAHKLFSEENEVATILKGDIKRPEELKAIENIAMGAFVQKDYDTLQSAITNLGNLIMLPGNKNSKVIIDSIRSIGLSLINDSYATHLNFNTLNNVANWSIQQGKDEILFTTLQTIELIAREAIRQNSVSAALIASNALLDMVIFHVQKPDASFSFTILQDIGNTMSRIAEEAEVRKVNGPVQPCASGLWLIGAAVQRDSPHLNHSIADLIRKVTGGTHLSVVGTVRRAYEDWLNRGLAINNIQGIHAEDLKSFRVFYDSNKSN